MKKTTALLIAVAISLSITSAAYARNTQYFLPINNAMNTKAAQEKLDKSLKFFFGDQQHPPILTNLGSGVSNRKTNSFSKSDLNACNWGFLSAILSLQDRAHQLGANAVVHIVSYYDKNEIANQANFECHAGGVVAGVALKGDFVKIAGR